MHVFLHIAVILLSLKLPGGICTFSANLWRVHQVYMLRNRSGRSTPVGHKAGSEATPVRCLSPAHSSHSYGDSITTNTLTHSAYLLAQHPPLPQSPSHEVGNNVDSGKVPLLLALGVREGLLHRGEGIPWVSGITCVLVFLLFKGVVIVPLPGSNRPFGTHTHTHTHTHTSATSEKPPASTTTPPSGASPELLFPGQWGELDPHFTEGGPAKWHMAPLLLSGPKISREGCGGTGDSTAGVGGKTTGKSRHRQKRNRARQQVRSEGKRWQGKGT